MVVLEQQEQRIDDERVEGIPDEHWNVATLPKALASPTLGLEQQRGTPGLIAVQDSRPPHADDYTKTDLQYGEEPALLEQIDSDGHMQLPDDYMLTAGDFDDAGEEDYEEERTLLKQIERDVCPYEVDGYEEVGNEPWHEYGYVERRSDEYQEEREVLEQMDRDNETSDVLEHRQEKQNLIWKSRFSLKKQI